MKLSKSFCYSPELVELFDRLKISLILSSARAQLLIVICASGGRIHAEAVPFPKATGIALAPGRMAVCGKREVWFFDEIQDFRTDDGQTLYQKAYIPRYCHITGDIAAHECSWVDQTLLIVNTRYSCICSLDTRWSFVPVWKPNFVSSLAPEDRCHLNGLAAQNGKPLFASAFAVSDGQDGWRTSTPKSGVVIDIPSNKVILNELAMPHSPRFHRGHLWVLEAGTQRLLRSNHQEAIEEVAVLPGFARGLDFYDRFAFVGTSHMREQSLTSGLVRPEAANSFECGVWIIDLETGKNLGGIKLPAEVEELFSVLVVPGCSTLGIIAPTSEILDGAIFMP